MWLNDKDGNELIYWRKANAIHNWFVENVQIGADDCGDYEITREQLEKLLSDVISVLDSEELAEEVLPTCAGFFFGGTDYDEGYFADLIFTKDKLTKLLKENKDEVFFYTSSW